MAASSPSTPRSAARLLPETLLASALLLVAALASADEAWVIAPGQEALLTSLLGGPDPLPGPCHLLGAGVDRAVVRARYACDGRPALDLELQRPGTTGLRPLAETAHFWLTAPAAADPPPALIAALAARIRAGEAPFRWSSPDWSPRPAGSAAEAEGPPPAVHTPPTAPPPSIERYLGWAALPLLFWLDRLASPPRLAALQRLAFAAGAGFAAFSLLYSASRLLGRTAAAVVFRERWVTIGALLAALIAALAFSALVRLWRSKPRRPLQLLAASIVALGAVGWTFLADTADAASEPASFGRILALPPRALQTDSSPHRPTIQVTTNAHGFRGPDFAERPAPGTTRVVLIGDSFVFGSGVEWPDTLGEALRRELARQAPGRAFELINLGIPGDNLPSHVEVYDEAVRALHPAQVVLCLTLPNDLSNYDDQEVRRAERRASSYQLVQWSLGAPFARLVWGAGKLARAYDDEALAVLDREAHRLAALRSGGGAPPLLVFSYFGGPQDVGEAVARIPGAVLVPNPPHELADWIPDDWHPTAQGNRAFAVPMAQALLGRATPAP